MPTQAHIEYYIPIEISLYIPYTYLVLALAFHFHIRIQFYKLVKIELNSNPNNKINRPKTNNEKNTYQNTEHQVHLVSTFNICAQCTHTVARTYSTYSCGMLIFFPVKSFSFRWIHIFQWYSSPQVFLALLENSILWKRIWFAACSWKSNASAHASEASKDIENTAQYKTGNYTVFEWHNKWMCGIDDKCCWWWRCCSHSIFDHNQWMHWAKSLPSIISLSFRLPFLWCVIAHSVIDGNRKHKSKNTYCYWMNQIHFVSNIPGWCSVEQSIQQNLTETWIFPRNWNPNLKTPYRLRIKNSLLLLAFRCSLKQCPSELELSIILRVTAWKETQRETNLVLHSVWS